MLFSSLPFLFWFLPILLICYYLVPGYLKNGVLLFFSLVFYAWGEPRYVLLMMASILFGWGSGLLIHKRRGKKGTKALLGLSVAGSLSVLLFFKYTDFMIDNLNGLTGLSLPLLRLALPIGVSFYTFQILSYSVDVYRGDVKVQKNLVDFGAYVTMFPQLIAGPIVRYADIEKQLKKRPHSLTLFSEGIQRFLMGLGKKVLLANAFGDLCAAFRAADAETLLFYWMYALAFTLQIYFDFSGYSDMAIGLGKILGFSFQENFQYPYCARSITAFWRRWHISLGSWFRDYVYIPLGGNRVKRGRWLFNIALVWMLTGLWHGAAWNFVLWGMLYGGLLMAEKLWLGKWLKKLPGIFQHIYVLFFVIMGFVLFNAESLTQAWTDIKGLFAFSRLPLYNQEALYYLRSYAVTFGLGLLGCTSLLKRWIMSIENSKTGEKGLTVLRPLVLASILLICTGYLVDGSFNPFLYFRF